MASMDSIQAGKAGNCGETGKVGDNEAIRKQGDTKKTGKGEVFRRLQKDMNYRFKLMKTISVFLTGIVLGIVFSHLGPALPDIKRLIDTDLETASWLFTATSVGYLLGVLVSGGIFDRLRPMLFLFVSSVSSTALTSVLPWFPTFWSMIFIRVLTGFAAGSLDTAEIACIARIWRAEVRPYMHIMQLVMSIGGIITPLIIRPFLHSPDTEQGIHSNASIQSNTSKGQVDNMAWLPSSTEAYKRKTWFQRNGTMAWIEENPENNLGKATLIQGTEALHQDSLLGNYVTASVHDINSSITQVIHENGHDDIRIHYAFIIFGITGLLCSGSVLYFVIVEGPEKDNKRDCTHKHSEKGQGRGHPQVPLTVKVVLMGILAAQAFLYATQFLKFISFLTTFCIMHMKWSSQMASNANALFWASFAVARSIGGYLVTRFDQNLVILLFYILATTGAVICTIASVLRIDIFFWFSIAFFGASVSIQFPSIFTWTEEYFIPLTGKETALFLFFFQSGAIIDPIFVSYLMEKLSPLWFVYLLLISSTLAFILFVTANIMRIRYLSKTALSLDIDGRTELQEKRGLRDESLEDS